MPEHSDQEATPLGQTLSGGRYLIGGLCLVAIILLAMIGTQTVRSSAAGSAQAGGWWAEPALAPGFALVITIITAAVAVIYARPERIDWNDVLRSYGPVTLLAGSMIVTVVLMGILGFALSLFLFAGVTAYIGGYRGGRLLAIATLTCLAMVLIFRVGFSVWFPRPMLFRWIDLPLWLQGIL